MIFIWFIYGLAFFTLGLVIIVYPKKPSMFKLANHIWLIAGFGLLHGINEWLDMFIAIGEPLSAEILRPLRMFTLVLSFLFLLRFGTKVIVEDKKKLRYLEALPIVLFVAWAVIFVLSSQKLLVGDITARYLLCAPGAVLTSLALFMQIPQFKETKLLNVVRNLKLTAITFLFYAVLAGLIVKKPLFPFAKFLTYDVFRDTFGAPVQIFRAACAVILACSTAYVLSVFRWETQQTQRKLDKYRSEMEKKTWLAEIGAMASTMAQKLDEPLAVTRLLLQRILTDLNGTSHADTVVSSLKKSMSEVSKATDIVKRFQSTAQVSNRITTEPVDLYQITKRILAVFAQSVQQANLAIAVKGVDVMLNLPIPAHQLEQVFFILVQNAINTSDTNKQQKLTISCHPGDEQVELRFSDTCGGIDKARLRHIFEPFFAAAPGTKQTDLGLTVAKQIICDYGGDITAQSRPGQGTILSVTLPIEQP
jgi:signal transduction histidine kinase